MSLFDHFCGIRRREFLKAGLAGFVSGGFSYSLFGNSTTKLPKTRDLTIRKVERINVKVPYRPAPGRNMARELPHWMYSEILKVHLQSGHIGVGETLLYYTWGVTNDADIKRAKGKNAAELMWDDSLGAGLQMALFDAVGKASDVPVHRLLGQQIYDKTPLSWWNIDTTAEDMASECKEAFRQGYRAYKTKGRPWFDLWQQMDLSVKELPSDFKIDMDFNDTLLDAKRAIPILKRLADYDQIDIYESPIFQDDVQGNQAIRQATRVAVAMHYGNPDPVTAISNKICDGFVIGGGATKLMKSAHVASTADLKFWLQLVGTGITAAWSLHFGAVCSHAKWPAVNCHQLYRHPLLKSPIKVVNGFADVPTEPGIGTEIDWDAVERFRISKPQRRPDPKRLVETTWPTGEKMYFNHQGGVNFVLNPARQGKVPYYVAGANTRLYADDGSAQWRDLYQRSSQGPLLIRD
ncbi:MAG: enolase C-terminal domain-like protein [Planctomycetota bacterium]|nr:enolase C-terminal domain-like protein [Planctomycetota bacterium]